MFSDLRSFGFNGLAVLGEVIARSSHGSLEQAVASLASFAHPETVSVPRGHGVFRKQGLFN